MCVNSIELNTFAPSPERSLMQRKAQRESLRPLQTRMMKVLMADEVLKVGAKSTAEQVLMPAPTAAYTRKFGDGRVPIADT